LNSLSKLVDDLINIRLRRSQGQDVLDDQNERKRTNLTVCHLLSCFILIL
jgi:hypothetical protein